MGIKPNFTKDDVKKRLDTLLYLVEEKQIDLMKELGEMCLIEAQTNKGYMMQTGNLMSSTGYTIFVDGVAVHSKFEAVQGANGVVATQGVQAGKTVAENVGKGTQGVCLVVVAGMNYAKYVEAKGKNVLGSAELLAERELPNMLRRLKGLLKSV